MHLKNFGASITSAEYRLEFLSGSEPRLNADFGVGVVYVEIASGIGLFV
jgi:hypothetical protein